LTALDKVYTTPTHIYTTLTMGPNGAGALHNEVIYVGGAVYTNATGSWSRGNLQQVIAMEQKNRENSKSTCQYVRDEAVDGESAAVYKTHAERADVGVTSDGWLWISKSSGLVLRLHEDIVTKDGIKETTSARYVYVNVRPPI
jgi:hypothetical protein